MNTLAIFLTVVGLVISYIGWYCASTVDGEDDWSYLRTKRWVNPTGLDLVRGVNYHAPKQYLNSPVLNPHVMEVTDGVHVAIDYALGNSIFLQGPEGVVVVDTTESLDSASRMLKDFRKICNKPIVAIVYTHHHGDHIHGTPVFIEDPSNPPDIWAHKNLKHELSQIFLNIPRNVRGRVHQFGMALAKHAGEEAGVNPRYVLGRLEVPRQPVEPTNYVEQDIEHVTIAGLNITFMHQPGETDDHLGVWLPDKKILLPGDNFYHIFPNLYAIRGVVPRSARHWFESLLKLRNLKPEYLVPSHGTPVIGEREVYETLSFYSSAIRFVHDQTIRLMNQGLHPDEVASRIKLPSSLTVHPSLREEYGLIAWSSKGVFQQQVGWFNGDPVDLYPHTPSQRARRMVDMVGERELLRHSEEALKQDDPQWALELSSYVLTYQPNSAHARDVRTDALRSLAGRQINRVARNFYLTAALDDHQLINWREIYGESLSLLEISPLLSVMTVRLDAEAVDGVNVTVVFHLTDTKETYRLQIVYSVLNVDLITEDDGSNLGGPWNVRATGSSELVKKIITRVCSPFSKCEGEKLKIEGSPEIFHKFIGYFDL